MGWVTPLGHELESVWRRMLQSESGVAPTTIFDGHTFPTSFAAEVKDFSLSTFLGDDAARHDSASRNTRFALAAASEAWKHAGMCDYIGLDASRVGVYLGGGEGPVDFDPLSSAGLAGCLSDSGEIQELDTIKWVQVAEKLLNGTNELEQEPNLAGAHIAAQFGAEGPNFNTLTACAASTQALGEAANIIRYGDADVMISGGTHSMIHPLGMTGFVRLTALSTRNDSPATASRPFDRTRDGFVLGEGAGILILEELEHARRRGAAVLGEIVGFGSTADAFRITDIDEDARGGIASMERAMKSAGMTPDDIDYISAHGTGTEENDKIESLAITKLFGERAGHVPMSSIKSMIGHLIAAAGAVELITCVLAMRDGVVPPTINYEHPDPNCPLDYVPNKPKSIPVRAALSNSFGFGGQNNTLIVKAPST